jgi:hypothetical protein
MINYDKLTVLSPAALHKRRMTSSRSWHGDSSPAWHCWLLEVLPVGPIHIPRHQVYICKIR